jgi:hypothetical protein
MARMAPMNVAAGRSAGAGLVLACWVAVAPLSGCSGVDAAPAAVALVESRGRAPSALERQALSPEWASFLEHARSYDVGPAQGRVALVVVSVSATRFYRHRPSGSVAVALPKPVLLTPQGKLVGQLPMSFPDDPPFELAVRFTAWQNNWPNRVDLFVKDPTVSGDRPLPSLAWDVSTARFVDTAKRP